MQTRAQSSLEAFVDFVCSIVVNVLGQRALYGAAATAGRITYFSSVFLAAVFVRRFLTRRAFEALTPAGTRQSRLQSALEVSSDTVLGFGIAIGLQMLIYKEDATLWHASGLTLGLYMLTIIRRYILRRFFDAFAARTAARQTVLAPHAPSSS